MRLPKITSILPLHFSSEKRNEPLAERLGEGRRLVVGGLRALQGGERLAGGGGGGGNGNEAGVLGL